MKSCVRKGFVLAVLLICWIVIAILSIYRRVNVDSAFRYVPKTLHLERNSNLIGQQSVFDAKWTYSLTSSMCTNNYDEDMSEDLFCMKRPTFLPNYKNPCWKELDDDGTEHVQCMPYFQLLGADKCGSTDLFDRIMQHPEIEPSSCAMQKECYYWCWQRYGLWMLNNYIPHKKTFKQYLRSFKQPSIDIQRRDVDGYHSHITGEGTPMDFWEFRGWPRIPQNKGLPTPRIMTPHLMKHVYPKPKFIVILRNPVDRLYSDYFFLGYGYSAERFHKDAVRAISMVNNCALNRTMDLCLFDMDMYVNLPTRIQVGCYSVFMKTWMNVFPRESFLVLRNEDYGRDIKSNVIKVYEHLNVSRLPDAEMDIISNAVRKHVTKSKKNKGPMMESTRRLLEDFYAPFNQELASLLQDERFLWKDRKHLNQTA